MEYLELIVLKGGANERKLPISPARGCIVYCLVLVDQAIL